MLALNHASLAITATLGLSLYFHMPFYLPLIVFAVFAGVMPDIDHPGSELGKYFKPIGALLPHRGVTHSIVGTVGVVGLLNYLVVNNKNITIFLIFASIFGWNILRKVFKQHILAIDEKTKNIISTKQTEVIFAGFSYIINTFLIFSLFLVWYKDYNNQILALIGVGYIAHLIGDFITIEGIPLLWPIKYKFGLKLFKTGSSVESFIGFVLFFVNLYLAYQFIIINNVNTLDYWRVV